MLKEIYSILKSILMFFANPVAIDIYMYVLVVVHITTCLALVILVFLQRGEEGIFKKFSTAQKTFSSGDARKLTAICAAIFMILPLLFYGLIKIQNTISVGLYL